MLAIDVAGSIRSARVIDVLARLITLHGPPAFLRSDNGPEFVSHAILDWLEQSNIGTAHIDPGSPWQNGTNESFNGKLRDECLNLEGFAVGGKPRSSSKPDDTVRRVHTYREHGGEPKKKPALVGLA